MTSSSNPLAKPGEQIHATRAVSITRQRGEGLFDSDSVLLERGQTVTLTAAMIEAQKDRNGDSILDRLGDPELPIQPGPWPEGEATWTAPGDPVWVEQRETARQRAFALVDPDERAEALAGVRQRFGRVPTSRTLSENSESVRAADDARLRGVTNGDRR